MKYTFTIIGHDQTDERGKIVLESRAGESARHIALKLLAYVLFKHEAAPLPFRIEQSVGQRHKPDLVTTDPETGAVRLWIDCGQIETKRLGRIVAQNAAAKVVVVKPTSNEARLYAQAALRFLPATPQRREAVRFVGFDETFLPAFLDNLRGSNEVQLVELPAPGQRTSRLALTINGVPVDSLVSCFTATTLPVRGQRAGENDAAAT